MEIIFAKMCIIFDEDVFDQFGITDEYTRRQELVVADVWSVWEFAGECKKWYKLRGSYFDLRLIQRCLLIPLVAQCARMLFECHRWPSVAKEECRLWIWHTASSPIAQFPLHP